jgi:glucosamine-6-phosphate deaminase
MGVASILAARSIVMLATGKHKAEVVTRALNEPMSAQLPASLLQSVAPKVTWLLDEASAANLG